MLRITLVQRDGHWSRQEDVDMLHMNACDIL